MVPCSQPPEPLALRPLKSQNRFARQQYWEINGRTKSNPRRRFNPPFNRSRGARRKSSPLQAYKADKITPIEYHTERAKILAEPNP
jgi:hypothetical protein